MLAGLSAESGAQNLPDTKHERYRRVHAARLPATKLPTLILHDTECCRLSDALRSSALIWLPDKDVRFRRRQSDRV
jgi:hypothetical protein